MNTTSRPTAGLATENFDTETLALLEAVEVPLPEFARLDLDVAFGMPLEMFEAGTLPHERLDGLDITAAVAAIEARETRMLVARDIVATDPTALELVRERLVDVLLPYAAQLRITRRPATAAPLPIAA
ncbi:hypothetical protein [Streptomyces sp. Vc17.3-30]|uniref:hypothetical protein n=1 Tax=Streptomyces sp. Vc17.3-30 TaxID=2841672 RepID=UPI002096284D|nr:hypothetical protein [Streptomyces sp. Vc17.3-30]MCO6698826.1 hypothetical protein [Streptomyces sp. Vc17.3-30]